MLRAWREVEKLVSENARHRKGFRLNEVSPAFILSHCIEEMDELCASPNDPSEMADLLGCLFHYAIHKGWSASQLEEAMLKKFKERFHAGDHGVR